MITKKESIQILIDEFRAPLNNRNTSFSNINVSKNVWWINIAPKKFEQDVNIILNSMDEIIWICLPKGFTNDLSSVFKIRNDKNVVDLEVSSDKKFKYLIDIKSGGTEFDFAPYIIKSITI